MSDLEIREVAARSGLSAHTLRYYERIGLLDPVARGAGGRRNYEDADLEWLAFLQRLRATGMPIRDMLRFAELRRGGDSTATARRTLLEEHRDEVLGRIRKLKRDLLELEKKIGHYERLESKDVSRHGSS